MRRYKRISPKQLPDNTICLSVSRPYWNTSAFSGLPSPYMVLVQFLERQDIQPEKWFYATRLDGRYLIFMERLTSIMDFYAFFPGRSQEVKTFDFHGRVFRGYSLDYGLESYVGMCRKLGFTKIDEARQLILLNSDISLERKKPIYYEQRDGRPTRMPARKGPSWLRWR